MNLGDIAKRLLKLTQKNTPNYHLRAQMLRWCGYKIGTDVYIGEDFLIIDELQDRGMVSIGSRVAIAPRVTLVVSSYPNNSRIRPYVRVYHGKIDIQDDVWIGTNAVIFPNVTIGEGSVIGASALVTHDVPPYTIAYGVPAKNMSQILVPWKNREDPS